VLFRSTRGLHGPTSGRLRRLKTATTRCHRKVPRQTGTLKRSLAGIEGESDAEVLLTRLRLRGRWNAPTA